MNVQPRASRNRWAVLVLGALLTFSGCAARRGVDVTYHDPDMDFSLIRSVAVMPLDNLSNNKTADASVRDVLMTVLQATGAFYVLPPGEVGRGISRLALASPSQPTAEEVVQFAEVVGVDVVFVGTVREYGELRSGGSVAGVVSFSLRMLEAQTGRVVWSASASAGGVSVKDRVFGGGGRPMDEVTRKAVSRVTDRLFR